MKLTRALFSTAALLGLVIGISQVRADDVKDLKTVARGLGEKAHKTVVVARLVLKVNTGGGEQEMKVETTGTVIDASGLTVVSAQAVDPSALTGAMGARGGRRGGGGGGGGGGGRGGMGGNAPEIKIDVSETTLVLEDGTEVESDVVLKDNELDLAFIRPRDAATKLDFVTLKARGTPVQALDDIIVVGRLGRTANRASSLMLGTVKAVVKGPRTYSVCDDELSRNSEGCVAYGSDGSTLGVFVTKSSGEAGGRRGAGGGAIMILRSVEDLIEIATQAKAAKAPEKKADADDDSKSDKPAAKDAPKTDKSADAPKTDKSADAPKADKSADAPKADPKKPAKKDDEGD